jgi:hypothetical protein
MSKVISMAEILFVMKSPATPVVVPFPVATTVPSISIVMAGVFTPIVSIPTSFVPLPLVALVTVSPVEIPMLA